MNGVIRGCAYNYQSDRERGARRGNVSLSYVQGYIGFRLNGVVRSGYYIYSSYRCCRCGYRTQLNKEWSSIAVSVGFRSEWCNVKWLLF